MNGASYTLLAFGAGVQMAWEPGLLLYKYVWVYSDNYQITD